MAYDGGPIPTSPTRRLSSVLAGSMIRASTRPPNTWSPPAARRDAIPKCHADLDHLAVRPASTGQLHRFIHPRPTILDVSIRSVLLWVDLIEKLGADLISIGEVWIVENIECFPRAVRAALESPAA